MVKVVELPRPSGYAWAFRRQLQGGIRGPSLVWGLLGPLRMTDFKHDVPVAAIVHESLHIVPNISNNKGHAVIPQPARDLSATAIDSIL